MKKYLFILIMAVPLLANGQFAKGTIYAGGLLNYSHVSGSTGSQYGIRPQAGIFLSPRLLVGLHLDYTLGTTSGQGDGSSFIDKFHTFGGGPFVRYYFPISSKFYFAVESSLIVTADKDVTTNYFGAQQGSTTTTSTYITLSVRPMLIYFPSPHWSVETGIASISGSHGSVKGGSTSNSFWMNAGSVNLGVAWYFNGRGTL